MKANELRMGNLVYFGVNIVPVKSIHTESVLKNEVTVYVELNKKLQNYCLSINEVKPIQLTKEVLLRCGFVHQFKSYKQDYFSLNIDELIYLTFDLRKNRITLHSHLLGAIKKFDYNYLHQIQNLYYSLRNEELTINHPSAK